MHVLYIDDNDLNRRVVETMLAARDVMMTGANNGAEGMVMLQDGAFDVLFLDLRMPSMDGHQVLELVRADPRVPEGFPIVVVTADASEGVERRVLAAGANALLHKPVSLVRLFEVLDTLDTE